jgi:hypothetical protein
VRNLKERQQHFQDLRVNGLGSIKTTLKKRISGCELVSTSPEEGPFTGCAENSQEPWGSTKGTEFLERLSGYEFLKKDHLSFELTSTLQSLFGFERPARKFDTSEKNMQLLVCEVIL